MKLQPAASTPAFAPIVAARVVDASSTPSAPVVDSTSLSGAAGTTAAPPTRHLWEEAARLGLLAGGGAVSGPIGGCLSAQSQTELRGVVDQLGKTFQFSQKRDVKMPWQDRYQALGANELFDQLVAARPQNLGLRLYVVGKDIEYSAVDSLAELQALDAFYNTGDLAHLPHPELATAVQHLSGKGTFFVPLEDNSDYSRPRSEDIRKTGQFGAYKEIINPSDKNRTLKIDKPDEYGTALPTEQDVEAFSFFKFDGPASGLARPDLAKAFVDLEKQGYSFHASTTSDRGMSAEDAWKSRMTKPGDDLVVGVAGIPIEKVREEALLDPSLFGSDLKTLKTLYDGTLKPLVDSKKITQYGAGLIVSACKKGIPGLDAEGCWHLLDDLRQAETKWVSAEDAPTQAMNDLEYLRKETGKDEDLKDSLTLYRRLIGSMPHSEAQSVFSYVRSGLKLESFNNDEFVQERERFLTLAGLVGNFQRARDVREVLGYDKAEPYEKRVEVLKQLADMEKKLTSQAPKPTEDNDGYRRREKPAPPSPADRVLDDYKLLLGYRNPGQSLAEAAEIFEGLESTMFAREGWKAVRDTFVFIQKGVELNALQGRTATEAVREVMQKYLLNGNLVASRDALRLPRETVDGSPKEVKQGDGDVTIGGVKVPVKSGTAPGF